MVQTIYIDPNTGNLGIGTTAATTALQVSGIVTASTFSGVGQGFSSMEVITSGTSWTIPANVYRIKVTLIGGGGGGGGAAGSQWNGGAGGGGGGGCIGYYNVIPNTSLTYTVGAAGTAGASSVPRAGGNGGSTSTTYNGTTFTANGGSGGTGSETAAALGGAGGTASGGSINITGQLGGRGGQADYGGICNGGNSPFGLGNGSPCRIGLNDNGDVGFGYGAGGSGGGNGAGTIARVGGAGTAGVIIIEY